MACLAQSDFEAYLAGRLDPSSREQVTAHLASCITCRTAFQRHHAGLPGAEEGGARAASQDVTIDTEQALSGSGPATPGMARQPRIEGYQITGVLGQGGMGIVYKAVQAKLSRAVALKVLPAMVGSANPAAVQRFRREATAAARLHHTNIVPIYDFGESADAYYYAMEYIVGRPLDEVIRSVAEKFDAPPTAAALATAIREIELPVFIVPDASSDGVRSATGAPPGSGSGSGLRGRAYYRQVARWMSDTAEALNYAHSQGIIHRDIKPSNLILSDDGRIMVADFGLAKSASEGSVTRTGALLGTLRYVSPEQAMARRMRVDHRTDVYSLGATMYELLCFRPAFPGDDDKEILGAIVTRDPPPPRKSNANVPAELETICMKCLEKSPDARYATARALAEDLRRYINDLPIVARRPGPLTRAYKFARRHRAPVIAAAAVVLVVASAVLWRVESAARRAAQVAQLNDSAQTWVEVTRQWDQAEADLREALRLDPESVATLLTLAWMKLEHYQAEPDAAGAESLERVIEACNRVLRTSPDNFRALGYLGLAQRRLGHYPEAIETLEKAVRLDPNDFASWSNLGSLYLVVGNVEKAAECLRKGADEAGTRPDRWRAAAWRNLATLALFQRDPDVAEHVATALACDVNDVLSWVVRSRIGLELAAHRNPGEALDDAKHADRLSDFGDARVKRIRAIAHLENHEPEAAIEQAELAVQLGDEPTINLLTMAAAAAELGRIEDARQYLERAEAAWPESLRKPDAFAASAGTGELWIDTAAERLALAERAKQTLAAASK